MKFPKTFLLLISCLLMQIQTVSAQNWDIHTLKNIQTYRTAQNDRLMYAYSASVFPVVVGMPLTELGLGLIKKDSTHLSNGIWMLSSVIINLGVTTTIKQTIRRPRPYQTYPELVAYYDPMTYSFPSGHTSLAFNMATSLVLAYPKWYVIIPAAGWSLGMAYSRMHLGVHYPTDVMAGAVLGTGSAIGSFYLNKWLQGKYCGHSRLRQLSFAVE